MINELSAAIPEKDRKKNGRTGHFLYRGESERLYKKLQQDLGNNIVLTSGIRGVVKQTHLFLAKTIQSKGNLSKASRSLALPGHSYHGVGDFDVGKIGFGRKTLPRRSLRPMNSGNWSILVMSTFAIHNTTCSAFAMNPGTLR